MVNYADSKIYKLVDKTTNTTIYIGSTTQHLCKRMSCHRSNMKLKPNVSLYKRMNEIGVDNIIIELIENYPCESKEELFKREREHIVNNRLIGGCLNKNMPIILPIDSEYLMQKRKDYYLDNKALIINRSLNHYYCNIQSKRQYYQDNKDRLKAYQKSYYHSKKY